MLDNDTTLLELEHTWAKAFRPLDLASLEKLLAPEFRLSFVNDPRAPSVVSREAWFGMIGRMTLGSYEIRTSQQVVLGDVGVIQMSLSFHDWRLDGRLLPSEFRVTDVFVRRGGEWQVVQRISEPVADAPEF